MDVKTEFNAQYDATTGIITIRSSDPKEDPNRWHLDVKAPSAIMQLTFWANSKVRDGIEYANWNDALVEANELYWESNPDRRTILRAVVCLARVIGGYPHGHPLYHPFFHDRHGPKVSARYHMKTEELEKIASYPDLDTDDSVGITAGFTMGALMQQMPGDHWLGPLDAAINSWARIFWMGH